MAAAAATVAQRTRTRSYSFLSFLCTSAGHPSWPSTQETHESKAEEKRVTLLLVDQLRDDQTHLHLDPSSSSGIFLASKYIRNKPAYIAAASSATITSEWSIFSVVSPSLCLSVSLFCRFTPNIWYLVFFNLQTVSFFCTPGSWLSSHRHTSSARILIFSY